MTEPIQNTVQLRFFELLKNSIPSTVSLPDELMDLFNVGKDSAYRRIKGDTLLTLDEADLICEHFNLPWGMLSSRAKNQVTFVYESFGVNELDINGYLTSIIGNLEQLQKKPGIHIYFAAEFVPVFHHFGYDEMTAFKFFYWKKSIVNDKNLEGKKFEFKSISEETLQLSKKALDLYRAIPSTEIWNVETINSTVMQVLYYWEAGLFQSKQEALVICEQLRHMVEKIQEEAETGTKKSGAAFNMYASDVMIGNNSVLGTAENFKISLLTFNTFNSLTTTNTGFCEESEIWINSLMKKSMLLSGVSEKQRLQFFLKIFHVIDQLKMKIENSGVILSLTPQLQ